MLHDGACRLHGAARRSARIWCRSVRENPGRTRRIWGRSSVSMGRSCVPTYSLSSGASITDGIPMLLVPECFPCIWGLPLAEHGEDQAERAASREGQSSAILIGQMNDDAQRQERKTNCFHG